MNYEEISFYEGLANLATGLQSALDAGYTKKQNKQNQLDLHDSLNNPSKYQDPENPVFGKGMSVQNYVNLEVNKAILTGDPEEIARTKDRVNDTLVKYADSSGKNFSSDTRQAMNMSLDKIREGINSHVDAFNLKLMDGKMKLSQEDQWASNIQKAGGNSYFLNGILEDSKSPEERNNLRNMIANSITKDVINNGDVNALENIKKNVDETDLSDNQKVGLTNLIRKHQRDLTAVNNIEARKTTAANISAVNQGDFKSITGLPIINEGREGMTTQNGIYVGNFNNIANVSKFLKDYKDYPSWIAHNPEIQSIWAVANKIQKNPSVINQMKQQTGDKLRFMPTKALSQDVSEIMKNEEYRIGDNFSLGKFLKSKHLTENDFNKIKTNAEKMVGVKYSNDVALSSANKFGKNLEGNTTGDKVFGNQFAYGKYQNTLGDAIKNAVRDSGFTAVRFDKDKYMLYASPEEFQNELTLVNKSLTQGKGMRGLREEFGAGLMQNGESQSKELKQFIFMRDFSSASANGSPEVIDMYRKAFMANKWDNLRIDYDGDGEITLFDGQVPYLNQMLEIPINKPTRQGNQTNKTSNKETEKKDSKNRRVLG